MCGDPITGDATKHFCKAPLKYDGYSWITVKKYKGPNLDDPCFSWEDEYEKLLKHHKEETEFLINKIREISNGH